MEQLEALKEKMSASGGKKENGSGGRLEALR